MGSLRITCHPTQVNVPRLNPSLPWRVRGMKGWVDLGGWLHTEMVYVPIGIQWLIQVLTRPGVKQLRWLNTTRYRYATPPNITGSHRFTRSALLGKNTPNLFLVGALPRNNPPRELVTLPILSNKLGKNTAFSVDSHSIWRLRHLDPFHFLWKFSEGDHEYACRSTLIIGMQHFTVWRERGSTLMGWMLGWSLEWFAQCEKAGYRHSWAQSVTDEQWERTVCDAAEDIWLIWLWLCERCANSQCTIMYATQRNTKVSVFWRRVQSDVNELNWHGLVFDELTLRRKQ